MAENRYGGYRREGWRESEGSIFSDDDDRWGRGSGRWSSEHGRDRGDRGRDDDRGFFERAGDEVRSWFGDDEAERRREMDLHRDDARSAFSSDRERREEGGRDYGRRYESGSTGLTGGFGSTFGSRSNESGGSDWAQERSRGESGIRGGQSSDRFGGSQFEGRSGFGGQSRQSFGGGRSQWDENYQRWRSQQLEQFDREFDDYCRERQRQFDQDFDSWRTSRLTEGGSSGTPSLQTSGGSATGFSGDSSRSQGQAASPSGSLGSQSAGTTAGGGGTGSGRESSTGSTGAAAETGRGRRSRT